MSAKRIFLAALVFSLPVMNAHAAESTSLLDAVSAGKTHVNFRYRVEGVTQDGLQHDGLASTLRTRLNFTTGLWQGFNAFIEMDNVSYLGNASFNNTRNGKTTYPIIADPRGTDLNQFYVKYSDFPGHVILGRQRINLDNQRFLGGVGWRQNEQTYDAAVVSYKAVPDLVLGYGYINRVARVFGPDAGSPPAHFDSNSHVLHVDYDAHEVGRIVGYGYFLDLSNAPADSSQTLGVRYTNRFKMDGVSIPLTVEFARQQDYGDNPVSYSANYLNVEIGVDTGPLHLLVGDAVLGSDSGAGVAFSTPLATLHGFQGWADKFLATPALGIDDRYLTAGYKVGDSSFLLTWHDFRSDAGSVKYGTELDLSFGQKLSAEASVLIKYANYSADAFATDTRKFWLMFVVAL